MNKRVAVLGATGHTGSFVIAELRRRGVTPIPCGRTTDLDLAFRGAHAVINCAGPFAATAAPTIKTGDFASVCVRSITRTSLDRPFANHTSWRGAVGRHPKLLSSTRPGRQFNNG